jgi:hypothetical protein
MGGWLEEGLEAPLGMLLLRGEGHIDACLLIGGLVVDVHGPS